MRFYQQQHAYYCGIDLHARTMQVCAAGWPGLSNKQNGWHRYLNLCERSELETHCFCDFQQQGFTHHSCK